MATASGSFATLRAAAATLLAAALPLVGVAVIGWYGREIAAWFERAEAWQATLAVLAAGTLLCGLALLPTHALSLAAGYALGGWLGPLVAWVTVVAASFVGYGFGRVVGGRGFAENLKHRERLGRVYEAIVTASPRRTVGLIALLRLSPLAPFAATNVALATLGVRPLPYVLGAAIGLLPRVAVVAWLGAGMGTLDWQSPGTPWLLVAGGVATVLALVLIGRVATAALGRPTTSIVSCE